MTRLWLNSVSMPAHLVAENLRRSFKVGTKKIDVLRGISLSIEHGASVFLVGASGAGKTTLLYTLAGLERPEAGTVALNGTSLYTSSGNALARLRNQHMGFVFQSYFLLPELTALENVLVPAMIRGTDARERALSLLDTVGLANRQSHLPTELSGGEQQRVAIARALINDPGILFADEPTGNLDSTTGGGIMDLLLSMVRERAKTLVVVTHDARLAALGDRRLEVADGILKN